MKGERHKAYTLNKGEWSEVYCLIKTIADGQLELVDSQLIAKHDFITVVGGKISFSNSKEDYEYSLSKDKVEIHNKSKITMKLERADFNKLSGSILDKILNARDKTFPIDEVQETFSNIGVLKLKSNSLTKEDLIFKISDDELPNKEYLGFSIKSFLAGSPTLVNASGATNFIYETKITKSKFALYKELKTKNLIRHLIGDNHHIKFKKISSEVYQRNLMLIDINMPQIIAEMLKLYFSGKHCMVKDIASNLKSANPLKIGDVSIYENKIKDFLFSSALGMFPDKAWDGLRSVDGGLIVINPRGELGTFYIVRKKYLAFFREYLFQHCYLDTASTTRHKFGRLVFDEEMRTYFIKLNLQIRVRSYSKK